MKHIQDGFISTAVAFAMSIPYLSFAAEYPSAVQGTFQIGEGTCDFIKKNPSLASEPAVITRAKSKSEYETCTAISAKQTKPNEFAIVENCIGEDGGGRSARTYKIVNNKKILVVTKDGTVVMESCS